MKYETSRVSLLWWPLTNLLSTRKWAEPQWQDFLVEAVTHPSDGGCGGGPPWNDLGHHWPVSGVGGGGGRCGGVSPHTAVRAPGQAWQDVHFSEQKRNGRDKSEAIARERQLSSLPYACEGESAGLINIRQGFKHKYLQLLPSLRNGNRMLTNQNLHSSGRRIFPLNILWNERYSFWIDSELQEFYWVPQRKSISNNYQLYYLLIDLFISSRVFLWLRKKKWQDSYC